MTTECKYHHKNNSSSQQRTVNVAVLGQGAVGGEVINALHAPHPHIDSHANALIRLAAIHRRSPKKAGTFFREYPSYYKEIHDILNDDSIEVVCELMGGMDDARFAIEQALQRGKHVVTANKALLANEWAELVHLAKENNAQLRCEAAVAGGIPILHAISESAAGETIESVRGVINGTTNFILTYMENAGVSFDDALRTAQGLQYAEANPYADVSGEDARQKLTLLTAAAFNTYIPPTVIPLEGIERITHKDIEHAASMGLSIKLIAGVERIREHLHARVGPMLVPFDSPLGQVPANMNAIELKSNLNSTGNFFRGEGAGGKPTASAVLADVVSTVRNLDGGFSSSIPLCDTRASVSENTEHHAFYVRFVIKDDVGVVGKLSAVLASHNININSINQLPYNRDERDALPFYITVEDTTESNLRSALKEISAFSFNVEEPLSIPFERDDLWRKKG